MLSKRTRLIFKIIIGVMMAISVTLGAFILYYVFSDHDTFPYFLNHFGIAIILVCVSVIAFLLPLLAKKKYSDDSRDGIMILASGLLILLALLSIIMSYLGIGFYGNL